MEELACGGEPEVKVMPVSAVTGQASQNLFWICTAYIMPSEL